MDDLISIADSISGEEKKERVQIAVTLQESDVFENLYVIGGRIHV